MNTEEPNADAPEAEAGPAFDPTDPAYWEGVLGSQAHAGWLLRDPEVQQAIQSGRPHTVYEVFQKKLPDAPTEIAGEALEAVLAERRHFVDAAAAPGMTTLNGIGTHLYGSQDKNTEDGTYIATLFATILFLPIWPIRQYLVAKAQKGGWFFIGSVPLSRFHRLWRRAVTVGSVVLVVGIAVGIWQHETQADVHFLNGLAFPVTITMDDVEIRVAPNGRETRTFGSGRHRIVATRQDGTLLEEAEVELPGGADLVLYNVLGAAAILYETIPYSADDVETTLLENSYRARCLSGPSWVTRDDVDHVFEENPDEVSMGKSETIVTRSRVSRMPGGWEAAVWSLAEEGRAQAAADLALRVALLTPTDLAAARVALYYADAESEDAPAWTLLDAVLAASPDSIPAHRIYQSHMEIHGRADEILPRYRKAYEADPDSPRHAYLYARLVPYAEALAIAEPLVAAHPDDAWLHRIVAWAHFQQGRFETARPHYEKLATLVPEEKGVFLPFLARALVAAGRPEAALTAVSAFLDAVPARKARGEDLVSGSDAWTLMSLYARLQRLVPQDARGPAIAERWRLFIEEAIEPETVAATAVSARDATQVDALRPRIQNRETLRQLDLTLISHTNVEEAARLALDVGDEIVSVLDDIAQLSIACELVRLGHRDRALQIHGMLSPDAARTATMADLDALPDVEGIEEDLDLELKAVLLYAASRRIEDPSARDALLERARRFDVLGVVLPDP